MSTNLFPIIENTTMSPTADLPLFREIAWNFEADQPVIYHGEPVEVTGLEAVRVWAWHALKTVRFRHEIYGWDYGCELETLIGQPFTQRVKQSEAIRYVREALLESPYITDVRSISVTFRETVLTIECTVQTVYGEVMISV